MMYSKLLLVMFTTTAMYASLLAVVGIVTNTRSDRISSIRIPHFLEHTLTSSAHTGIAVMKRQTTDGTEITIGNMTIALGIISFILEFIVFTLILWFVWRTCFRPWYQRRRWLRNPESQRAEQLLNSPRHPVDLELGVIHARSPPNWPLTDGIDMHTTTPDNYDAKNNRTQSDPSACCVMHSNYTHTTSSDARSSSVDAEGVDIADLAMAYNCFADTDSIQASEFNTRETDSHIEIPHSQAEESNMAFEDRQTRLSTACEGQEKAAAEVSDQDTHSLASTACESDVVSNRSEQLSIMSGTTAAPSHACCLHETEAVDHSPQNGCIGGNCTYNTH
ncbi:hypothetical protein GGR55DRAFT_633774 [Xylaria sp. FL0064]|nr:hypothetical protein GGR55DRAFT_633774 [Xylaria sp. FL0064]